MPVPPNPADWSKRDLEDWRIGTGLIDTCVDTYTQTKTGLGPEIVFFFGREDPRAETEDWYIKEKTCVRDEPSLDVPCARVLIWVCFSSDLPLIDARNILR